MNTAMLFIGTKLVKSSPMTRLEYNQYRNWLVLEHEDGSEPGYLIEYTDGGKPNDPRHAGYISWSPKEQFDKAYRPVEGGMTFGLALDALKTGMAVSRHGWNGKGMCVYLVPANAYPAQTDVAKAFYGDKLVPYNAYFALRGADGRVSTWAPSGSDALAEDWTIVS